eukprot:3222486-Rhodomonas_salina.3
MRMPARTSNPPLTFELRDGLRDLLLKLPHPPLRCPSHPSSQHPAPQQMAAHHITSHRST